MILDILVVMIYIREISSMLYQTELGTICMILEIFYSGNTDPLAYLTGQRFFLKSGISKMKKS